MNIVVYVLFMYILMIETKLKNIKEIDYTTSTLNISKDECIKELEKFT